VKIVVCIKQVPETTEVKINPQTNTLMREGVASITNPFDEFALEESLLTKEKHGGEIHVITMGPPQAIDVLKNAAAVGADKVYLLSDRAFAGADTLATAYTLAKAIEKIGDVDLIICGKQAIDGDTAQVGPGIATRLGIPQLTYVATVGEIDPAKKKIVVERMLENGRGNVVFAPGRHHCRRTSTSQDCPPFWESRRRPKPRSPRGPQGCWR
jgi:electron transfer flavoprotein beta subunit